MLDVLQRDRQQVELLLPVLAVAIEPDGGVEDRAGVQAASADPPGSLLVDETGANQDLDMLRYRLQRDREGRGDFRNQKLATAEPAQNGAPDRVRKRRKHLAQAGVVVGPVRLVGKSKLCPHAGIISTFELIINHTVDYYPPLREQVSRYLHFGRTNPNFTKEIKERRGASCGRQRWWEQR